MTFSLSFVGALDYFPNVDGLHWFARKIWPDLRSELPEIVLNVIGRNPSGSARTLARIEGIRVVGPVDDVRPHLATAGAVVAPLRIARGIQNKVLEAMAMGKPVVATPQAAEGIDAVPDKDLIVAQDAKTWVEAIRALATQPRLAEQIGGAARQLILNRYNWNERLKLLDRLLELEPATPR